MGKPFVMYMLFIFYTLVGTALADASAEKQVSAEEEKMIAVIEILELMEMVDDLALLQDMEYLLEGDPNESQD